MYRCKARKKYGVDCKSEEEVVLYSVTIPTTVRPSAAVIEVDGSISLHSKHDFHEKKNSPTIRFSKVN